MTNSPIMCTQKKPNIQYMKRGEEIDFESHRRKRDEAVEFVIATLGEDARDIVLMVEELSTKIFSEVFAILNLEIRKRTNKASKIKRGILRVSDKAEAIAQKHVHDTFNENIAMDPDDPDNMSPGEEENNEALLKALYEIAIHDLHLHMINALVDSGSLED